MSSRPAATPALDRALAGVRGFILDADGVLIYRGEPIDGAPAALRTLADMGVPYRVVTNFSLTHRSTLAVRFRDTFGDDVEASRIITAASAAAAYTATHHPGGTLMVLAAPDALREWEGQRVAPLATLESDRQQADAVVIGDAGDALSYRNMDTAFRQIQAGAEFIAMHRNPWWMTSRGLTLDAGAVVAGLEFATGRKAVICGKPSPMVFRQAIAELRSDVVAMGGPRLTTADVAMVGDDPKADIAAARRVGLRGILVVSGKVTHDQAVASGVRADSIAVDFVSVVAAFRRASGTPAG